MAKLTREQELAAKLAAMQRQMDALQQQLAAAQHGRGAIGQGGGMAAGERGAAIGTNQGNSATGDYARQIQADQYVEQMVNQIMADPTRADRDSLRLAYLYRLCEQTKVLSLTGVDPQAASRETEARLQLDAVYTALLTQQSAAQDPPNFPQQAGDRSVLGEREPRRLSAVEQLNRHPRLVLLGDPGSGKSTFVNFVAFCLAGEAVQVATGRPMPANLALLTAPLPADEDDKRKKEEKSQTWMYGPLLPVHIILRDFAARGLPPTGQRATADHLWAFICTDQLAKAALADYAPHLRNELLQQGGLILLDGLDEVPEAEERRVQIKQAIDDFVQTFHRCRIVVTSRTYAYQRQAWHLANFNEALLAPFIPSQIRHFVTRWYAHSAEQRRLTATDAQGRAKLLTQAIFASDRLRELAERPLLLTLMASLHAWRGGNLPEGREELYADTVSLLLDRWESQRIVRDAQGEINIIQPSLQEFLQIDRKQLQLLLNRVAFQSHATQPDLVGTADIAESVLVTGLLAMRQNPDAKPLRLIEYLSQRAGLLLPRGVGVYSFPHRSFQEYLAACHLTDHEYPDQLAELARHAPERWREVTLLAGAKAARGTPSALWSLVDALCYREPEDLDYSIADDWGAHLAGQALVETVDLDQISDRHQRKVACVRHGLLHVMRKSPLPALERAHAGRTLAKLGDVRAEVLTAVQMHFCAVPAGPFVMGEGNQQHTNAHLDYDFWMARYPVTNGQFQQFIDAGGYATEIYWPEAITAGFWQAGKFKGRYDTEPRNRPYNIGEPFTLPNHPVVGVSWYEALAFARWLTAQLGAQLPPGWQITLPSAAEWEKAARGGEDIPVTPHTFALAPPVAPAPLMPNPHATRPYPWGDDNGMVEERANCKETTLASTSAVGCFPAGASPYGVEEMAGNVWEWTRTLGGFGDPYDPTDGREDLKAGDSVWRMLRGGAFYNEGGAVGCGVRYRYYPGYRRYYYGFRIVASPSTSGL